MSRRVTSKAEKKWEFDVWIKSLSCVCVYVTCVCMTNTYLGRRGVAHDGSKYSNGMNCNAVRTFFPDLQTHTSQVASLLHTPT